DDLGRPHRFVDGRLLPHRHTHIHTHTQRDGACTRRRASADPSLGAPPIPRSATLVGARPTNHPQSRTTTICSPSWRPFIPRLQPGAFWPVSCNTGLRVVCHRLGAVL